MRCFSAVFFSTSIRSNSTSVKQKQHCELRQNQQVQQADRFKHQTVTFFCIFNIHFSIYPNYKQACECLMKKNDAGS